MTVGRHAPMHATLRVEAGAFPRMRCAIAQGRSNAFVRERAAQGVIH